MNWHTNTLNKVKYICFLKREYRGLTAKDMREFYGDRKDLHVDGSNGSICLSSSLTIYHWLYTLIGGLGFM